MILFKTGRTKWKNQHETFTENIKDLYEVGNENALNALDGYIDTVKGLQMIFKESIDKSIPLRLLGAGWSWSKIAASSNGIIVDTKQLNTLFPITTTHVSPRYGGDPSKLFLVQCGTGIWELSRALRPLKLSLKTSGASNGQTIAGAIATGAHGAALDFGAVQDFVVGLHLIVSPTKHVYLQRKTKPVITKSLTDKLQAELIEDDNLFCAALVSMGCFGIVAGVMVETEDLFLLEAYMRKMPYDDKLKRLMNTLDFSESILPCGAERPYHLGVQVNPYDKHNEAYVTAMYKRPYRDNYPRPVRNPNGLGPGDDAPCFIGQLTHLLPGAVPILVNKVIGNALVPYEKQMGTLGEIFSNTTLHGKLISAAIGLPIQYVTRVNDILLEMNKKDGPFAGVFSYRYVKKSQAKLAFTRYPITCALELDAAYSGAMVTFCNKVWNRLEREKIPFSFHWGKMGEITRDRIIKTYGNDLSDWLKARNQLLTGANKAAFNNTLTKHWGLDG